MNFSPPSGGVCVKAPRNTVLHLGIALWQKQDFWSRGHRPIVDTCANEAIPQWGKHNLISCVYLQFEFETVDKLFHCVVYHHSDSIRCPSDPCPFQFRPISTTFSCKSDQFSIQISDFDSLWTPLRRPTTIWSTTSPRWMASLGQFSMFVLIEAYETTFPYLELHQTTM